MIHNAHTILNQKEIRSRIFDAFLNELPFNALFHYELGNICDNSVELVFDRQDELIGNKMQNILHGGVISSALDTVGGLIAAQSIFLDVQECSLVDFQDRFSTLGTINLHINYLRPGRGTRFTACAKTQRQGNKIAVYMLSLHNEQHIEIASGIGTYLVG